MRSDMGTRKPFTFWTSKTKVWGETKPEAPVWAQVVTAALLFGGGFIGFALWGFIGAIIAGALAAIPATVTARKQTFSADLQSGTWECSSEDFWKPVKSKLMP